MPAHAPLPKAVSPSINAPAYAYDFSKISISHAPVAFQPKLTVNHPGDQYEREADRVADLVMQSARPTAVGVGGATSARIQRCAACGGSTSEEEHSEGMCPACAAAAQKDLKLQTKEAPGATPTVSPGVQATVEAMRGGGRPLDGATRAWMEPRFGHSFANVRVHTDESAIKASRMVNALAFTVGPDIAFGAGQYQPASDAGRRLLAHELAHVIQQSGGAPAAIQRQHHGEDANVSALPTAPMPDPARREHLSILLDQITIETQQSLQLRAQADRLPAGASDERTRLEETLDNSRLALIRLLEERVQLLDQELAAISAQVGPAPTSSPDQPQNDALGQAMSRYETERRQHEQQLHPLRRWEMRHEVGTIDSDIAAIDQELSTLPPVSDPANPTSELLLLRRNELEQRKRTLVTQLTSTATEYEQGDARWGARRYGTSPACTNIQEAGCGPTSLAIVLNYLYQEDPESLASSGSMEIVTPVETAAYAATNGRVCNSGTAGDTMVTNVSTQWPGFRGRRIDLNATASELRNGNLVIFLCKDCTGKNQSGGDKYYGGHFMVLNGVNDDATTFNVLDPGNGESSDISTIPRAQLESNTRGFWIIEPK